MTHLTHFGTADELCELNGVVVVGRKERNGIHTHTHTQGHTNTRKTPKEELGLGNRVRRGMS